MIPPAMMLYSSRRGRGGGSTRPATARLAAAPGRVRARAARALSVIVVNWNTREILRDCLRRWPRTWRRSTTR